MWKHIYIPSPKKAQEMNRKPAIVTLSLVLAALGQQRSPATNVEFIPGDAYFVFSVTERSLPRPSAEDSSIAFEYYVPPRLARICGYIGFKNLQLTGDCQEVAKKVGLSYRAIRRKHPPELIKIERNGRFEEIETNGAVSFVYNKDVNYRNVRLGLRYNEAWPDAPKAAYDAGDRAKKWQFGTPKSRRDYSIPYRTLVPTAQGVAEDWRMSARVRALQVHLEHEVAWAALGPEITRPVVMKVDDAIIIMCETADIESYFMQSESAFFYVISRQEHKKCYWEDGKLQCDNFSPLQ